MQSNLSSCPKNVFFVPKMPSPKGVAASYLFERSLRAYFHYHCALRCVATQHHATQRATVMEIGPYS